MPFNELQRRDSWPPTIVRIPASELENTFDPSLIDENPISFFLSTPEDIDDFLSDEELSAGIESTSKSHAIREISPSSLQRVPRLEEEEDEEEEAFAAPMTLRDFTERTSSGRESRAGQNSDRPGLGLGIILPDNAAMRGRARVRLAPGHGRARGRGRARTLSARRPQSWIAPSPEIFRIDEEREDDNEGGGGIQVGGVDMGRSISSPGGILKAASPSLSPGSRTGAKKRVHWADAVVHI